MNRIYNLFLLMLFLLPIEVLAYPEFIGLGYTSCLNCHYNGAGNGGLNDYGRGLFAAEIAAKPFWNSKKSDDELATSSGFLGSVELPRWFRPSLKYRGLQVVDNPRSPSQSQPKTYQMQQDINIHLPIDEEQKFLIAMNFSKVPRPQAAFPNKTFSNDEWLSREYYTRLQITDALWIYLGLLDKVYGIRHADHTASNRGFLGLGQNDQVHGLMVHMAGEKHEIFVQPFAGNLHQEKSLQFAGLATRYEYEPAEKWRIGFSLLHDADSLNTDKNLIGFLLKRGINGGHSVLFETGAKKTKSRAGASLTSAYVWTQASLKVSRGYFLQTIMEYLKNDTSKLGPESLRLGMGLLLFPLQRFEFRFFGMSNRIIDPTSISNDYWTWQSQLHLSF